MKSPLIWLAALALSWSAAASAQAGSWVDLSIQDLHTGQRIEEIHHRGRTYVAGTPGHRYALQIHNPTSERLLVVLSVDGVNVVTGQTADPRQSGYVIAPHSSTRVDGWRKSLDETAAFVFTSLPDSYAARTGRPDHVGVIGAAVFRERVQWHEEEEYTLRGEPAPAREKSATAAGAPASPSADSAMRSQPSPSLGTGHGERRWSPVSTTTFERASPTPVGVVAIEYDSRRNLERRGIVRPRGTRHPNPFPGGFVPDPR